MKTEPRWIDKDALLQLHAESLAEFGGAGGMRDEGLLDSALARPLNLHGYQAEVSLAELAACYCFGVAKNHAFVDGNKRAAFLTIGLFLAINGYGLKAEPADAVKAILAIAGGEMGETALARWIEQSAKSAD